MAGLPAHRTVIDCHRRKDDPVIGMLKPKDVRNERLQPRKDNQ
jgi:hypothetical protein